MCQYLWIADMCWCVPTCAVMCKHVKPLSAPLIPTIRTLSCMLACVSTFGLPIEVRNVTCCSVEDFKCILDRYLQTVPDEPQIPGYISQRRADTNSLLDMARMAKAHSNSLVEVPMGQSPTGRGGCAPNIAVAHWCQNTQQGNRGRTHLIAVI